jgi:hypothetical protein
MKGIKEISGHLLKIAGYAGGIAIIGGAYLLVDSIKNKPLSKEEVTEIVRTEIVPLQNQVLEIRTDQQTILVGFLPDIIYNQNILTNDFMIHLAHDSAAIKILNMRNQFKSVEVKKN